MPDQPPLGQQVVERLTAHGLTGDVFDTDAIVADAAQRIEMDTSLDALIGPGDPGAPSPFDPRDPR